MNDIKLDIRIFAAFLGMKLPEDNEFLDIVREAL